MNGYTPTDSPIELLIVDASVNDAEAHISNLRNAGLVIHPMLASDESSLIEAFDTGTPDMALISLKGESIDLDRCYKICRSASVDMPIIVTYTGESSDRMLQAMREGVRDVVANDDPGHLQLVVMREHKNLLLGKELAKTQAMLKEAEARCTTLIANSQDAIAYIHEGMHMHANQIYLDMFGYVSMEEIEGLPILDMVTAKYHKKIKAFLKKLGGKSDTLMVECQNSDEGAFDAKMEFSPATYDGEPCTQIIIRNFSQNRELEQTIELLSSQDPQTGLANRQYFMHKMDEGVARFSEEDRACCLLYIVIDNFKSIRSEVGIVLSDQLLKDIAELLKKQVNTSDLLARFGDHTFTLLSEKSDTTDSEILAEGIRGAIHAYNLPGCTVDVTCSVGLARMGHKIDSSQEFINHAYHAFEEARNNGGNGVSLYDPSEMQPSYGDDSSGDEARINELIEHALQNNRFRLVFQPIVSLQGDSRENYAVLTRLLDNNNEEILPDHFMKYAEEGAQMAKVDRWVINQAIAELTDQRKQGRRVNFFISLSSSALADHGLLLWVCDCLRQHNAKGAWLTFQIRDKDLRGNINTTKTLIDGLKKIKCQLAVDQFGTNPKAEALLKHLPIDFVKFDFELMSDLATKQEKQDYLGELNNLAKANDVKTIAMGVEDANSLAILWTLGVNYIQGYFLQEPSENISYEFSSP